MNHKFIILRLLILCTIILIIILGLKITPSFIISKMLLWLIFLLITISFFIINLIILIYPKFKGYMFKSLFISKYKETQIISSMLINIWSVLIFSTDFYWIYSIELIVEKNNSSLATFYLIQIIENYVKNLPEKMQGDMAICLALLDKIIMESHIMIKTNIPEVLEKYKNLLLTHNIEILPTNTATKIKDISEKELENFIIQCLKNMMEHPLWETFASRINSQKHYFYFSMDLDNYITERRRNYHNTIILGSWAYLYDKYVQERTLHIIEITEIAPIDIPMEPEKPLHPATPLLRGTNPNKFSEFFLGTPADHHDYSYINSPITIICVLTGVVLVIIVEIIEKLPQ